MRPSAGLDLACLFFADVHLVIFGCSAIAHFVFLWLVCRIPRDVTFAQLQVELLSMREVLRLFDDEGGSVWLAAQSRLQETPVQQGCVCA